MSTSGGNYLQKIVRLRDALRHCVWPANKSLAARLDAATTSLGFMQGFSEDEQRIYNEIMDLRVKTRREVAGTVAFYFNELSTAEKRSIVNNIIKLYERCLIRLGRRNDESTDIVIDFFR